MKNKILIIGPAWVGDMVMAQSLFRLIKQNHPNVVIDVVAPAWSGDLLDRMPEVSNAIIMPLAHGQLEIGTRYRLGKNLRSHGYDQAIVLPNSFKSALIPFFAKIPVRSGWRGEMRYGLLNDMRLLDEKRYPLMVERFMALGLQPEMALPLEYPLPELQISADQRHQALERLELQLPSRPVLAICPGAEFGPAKRWPEEYYAEVANAKLKEGWDVWLFGSSKDMPIAERIMQLTRQQCRNLTGKTKLDEGIDLLSLATQVLCNDSGLMHIAAALKKPLVAVYGPTSTAFTPPLEKRAKVLKLSLDCQPCFKRECPLTHHRCMVELQPKQILQALK